MATSHERGVKIYHRLDPDLRNLIESTLNIELVQLKSRSEDNYKHMVQQISWILSFSRDENERTPNYNDYYKDIGLPYHKIYFGFLSTPEEQITSSRARRRGHTTFVRETVTARFIVDDWIDEV